jgi:hypothetical protein
MELTRELIEAFAKCSDTRCEDCNERAKRLCNETGAVSQMETIAIALLAEMDKPKVWDGAPDDCTHCQVNFIRHMRAIHSVVYTRELPKSRERQIAEEYFELEASIGFCELAILKAKAEWEANL